MFGVLTKKSFYPWLVVLLCASFLFYKYTLQVFPGIITNNLMDEFHINGAELGNMAACYFYAYFFTQIMVGVLLDRFSVRTLSAIAILVSGIGAAWFATTDHLLDAGLARALMGFGTAFATVCYLKSTAMWFKPNQFAFVSGLLATAAMLGAVFGEAPVAMLVSHFGWRDTFFVIGLVGGLVALFFYIFVADRPKSEFGLDVKYGVSWKAIFAVFRKKENWLLTIYSGLTFTPISVFGGLWGVPFLMLKLGITKTEAAKMVSLIFIGWAVASPLWGLFSNAIGRRKPPMYIGACIAMLCMTLIIYMPYNNIYAYEFLLFVFGIGSAGFLPAFTMARELCSKDYVATGLSFMNMMNMIGIALAQPLIGLILDKMWQGEMLGTVRLYPLIAYQTALGILPLGMIIALIILPNIKETYCQSVQK